MARPQLGTLPATPVASAPGDAASAATSPGGASADGSHRHAREAFATTTAAIGASAGGSAATVSHGDHVHATGAGTPSTQAFGDAAAIGSGPAAAMSDHKHAMMAAPAAERAASSTTPLAPGTAAVGSGATDAKGDHVHPLIESVNFIIDGGGSVITTGLKGFITLDFACTIVDWTLLADVAGSIVVDIWKDTYANFPPTIADVITASAKPTLSAVAKNQSSTLTGWTTAIADGDILAFNVNSITTCTRVTIALRVART